MMQQYPVKFDKIYGFECKRDFTNVTVLMPSIQKCINQGANARGYNNVSDVIESMALFYNYINVDDDVTIFPTTKGLSSFLKEEIDSDDFVVLKMDVKGLEYELIDRMLSDGTFRLVDEVMFYFYTCPCTGASV